MQVENYQKKKLLDAYYSAAFYPAQGWIQVFVRGGGLYQSAKKQDVKFNLSYGVPKAFELT